jgi:hypothetical protein
MHESLSTRLDAILNRVATTKANARKTSPWLNKMKKAIEQKAWLEARSLLQSKQAQAVVGGGFASQAELDEIRSELDKFSLDARMQFMEQVERLCREAGLAPTSMDRASLALSVRGILHIEADAEGNRVCLKTLARKRSAPCNPEDVFREAQKLFTTIWGRRGDPAQFLEDLYKAYRCDHEDGKEALLSKVQKRVWENRQPQAFWETFNPDKARDYTLDEFSADLASLHTSKITKTRGGKQMHLAEHGGGICVYVSADQYNTYKFIRFA